MLNTASNTNIANNDFIKDVGFDIIRTAMVLKNLKWVQAFPDEPRFSNVKEQYWTVFNIMLTPQKHLKVFVGKIQSGTNLTQNGVFSPPNVYYKKFSKYLPSIVKEEYGFKGNKKSVLKQLEQKIEDIKNDE